MDIGKAFMDSWNTYIKNFIIILLAGIVSAILGILVCPFVGFQMMFVKAKRGAAVSFNDVFAPFTKFINLFFGAIWMGIILLALYIPAVLCFYLSWNAVGGILAVVAVLAAIYLAVGWMFALLIIHDKGTSINAGMKASRAMVSKGNWWMHLLLLVSGRYRRRDR